MNTNDETGKGKCDSDGHGKGCGFGGGFGDGSGDGYDDSGDDSVQVLIP